MCFTVWPTTDTSLLCPCLEYPLTRGSRRIHNLFVINTVRLTFVAESSTTLTRCIHMTTQPSFSYLRHMWNAHTVVLTVFRTCVDIRHMRRMVTVRLHQIGDRFHNTTTVVGILGVIVNRTQLLRIVRNAITGISVPHRIRLETAVTLPTVFFFWERHNIDTPLSHKHRKRIPVSLYKSAVYTPTTGAFTKSARGTVLDAFIVVLERLVDTFVVELVTAG
jgi:hypothetical protein